MASLLFSSSKRLKTTSALRNIILLVKDPIATAKFYNEAIGLQVRNQSDQMVEMETGSTTIIIKVGRLKICYKVSSLVAYVKA
jgi:catechol-2,3-dioxygenase